MLLKNEYRDRKRLPDLSSQPPFEVDVWQVEPARLTLSKPGTELRLEPRVMALLVTLAQAGGEVVSRAELLETAWSDTVVGDEALTVAVSKLRRALGERARGERYVETIPRVGYRLLVDTSGRGEEARRENRDTALLAPVAEVAVPALGQRWMPILRPAAIAAALAVVVWLAHTPTPPEAPAPPTPPQALGLTARPGLESQASFDPTAQRVVFHQQTGERSGLAVLDLETNETEWAVAGPAYAPSWSPLDQRIAFLLRHRERVMLSLVTAPGGEVEELREVSPSPLSGIGWSPDARHLAWAGYATELDAFALMELDMDGGLARRLTSPPRGSLGDGRPVYSPDGRFLAFTRGSNLYNYDLWVLDRDTLEARRLTHDGSRVWGFDWWPDSRGLVYSSNRSGPFHLWSRPIAGAAEPTWIPTAGDQVRFPTIRGRTLVYDTFEVPSNLFEAKAGGSVNLLETVSSKARESAPAWSPDGRRLAYGSERSGTAEVWLREEDGTTHRVSQLGASLIFSLAWAPDASDVVVLAMRDGRRILSTVNVRTGEARRLRVPDSLIAEGPVFAPDGGSVLFASSASGRFEIWQVGLDAAAEPLQVTDFGAVAVRFSSDGTRYVLPSRRAELLRQGRAGDWQPVLRNWQPQRVFAWAVLGDAVHALHQGAEGALVWKRWALESGTSVVLASVPQRLENGGFTVHPDGRTAVFGRLLPMESDLRLMTLPMRDSLWPARVTKGPRSARRTNRTGH